MKGLFNKQRKRVVAFCLAFVMIATTALQNDMMKVQAAEVAVTFTESAGYEEGAYAEFAPVAGADGYKAYVSKDGTNYTAIDNELIRQYADYWRVDTVGLTAGTYYLKVEALSGSTVVATGLTGGLTVTNYDRSGFAFSSASRLGSGSGAYNNDGSLKDGAQVVYVTAETAKTCKATVNGTEVTGIQAILDAKQKANTSNDILCIRIIGCVKAADVDSFSSSKEGIQVKGKSEYTPMNITIEGIGEDATVSGFGFLVRNAGNVEFRNFAIMNFMDDGISLDTANTNIWVHDMDFFYGSTGSDSDQAKGDGTVDMKGDSQYITVSYNHFWDSGKASLCGMKSETGENFITYHHNWFDHSDSRHPRIRTMSVHVYNNYYDGNSKYGVGAAQQSQAFVEANYFNNCKYPMLSSMQGSDIAGNPEGTFSGEDGGIIKAYNNVVVGATGLVYANSDAGTAAADAVEFDAYLASERTEQVPATVVAKQGGKTYNNFDTTVDLGVDASAMDAPENVPAVVSAKAGRLSGGDFKWDFSAESEDTNYDVITALKTAITNYSSSVVSIGGYTEGDSSDSGSGDNTGSEGGDTSGGGDSTDTPVVTGAQIQNFTENGTDSSFFTITGNLSTSKGTVTYNGLTLTQCLKMESSTNIAFTPASKGTLTLVFLESEAGKKVKVDGEKYTTESNVFTVELEAGDHTVTKGDTMNLFYMVFTPEATEGDNTTPDSGSGDSGNDGGNDSGSDDTGSDSGSTGEAITESVKLTDGLKTTETYGNAEVVKITVMDDMSYKEGEVSTPDGTTYPGYVQGSVNPSPNSGKVPTKGAVIKLEPVVDCTVYITYKSAKTSELESKKYYYFVNETAGTFETVDESSFDGTGKLYVPASYELKAGNTYYAYKTGSKASIAYLGYSYVEKAQVKTETVTASVDVSDGLIAGTTYGVAGAVEISVLEDMAFSAKAVTTTDGTSYEGYVKGSNNPKAGGSNCKGTVPEKGAAVKVVAVQDGKVSFTINSSTTKPYYFVTVDPSDAVTFETMDETGVDESLYVKKEYDVKAGYTYYMYRSGSKVSIADIGYTYEKVVTDEDEKIELPKVVAFEGAEGGGMYATGGRGGDIYVVTTLEDYGAGESAIEGSLRHAIETAPLSGRIIVFNVGGTIHLKQTLTFKGKENITIAGQTAPGEGITLGGYDTNISDSKNLIIRFVHFRTGTENLLNGGDSMDGLWGRDNDTFILDHCSFSWSTDETLSTYRGKNGTIQWCIISESLTVSGHSKGRHGYGGIWGGENTVFQYNLVTNHTSRNPRIGGGFMGDPTSNKSVATVQLSDNVIYNWGFYSCYGGGYTYSNFINNYLKAGPGTRDAVKNQIIEFGENNKVGGVYVNGNVLEGNAAVSADNSKGMEVVGDTTTVATTPYTAEAFDNVTLVAADVAYEQVLNRAGVTYPMRDAIDARVIAQVENNTGFYINTQDEIGGYCAPETTREASYDTDMDGIPDTWEKANGLNPNDATDSKKLASSGYAWVEVYFNELVKDVVAADYAAVNPDVSIDLANNTMVEEGKDVTVNAVATANNGGSIAEVWFFNGAEVVAKDKEAPFSYTYTGLADGTYNISVRAYDNAGNATQSNTMKLHVNSTAGTGDWTSVDIGTPAVAGTASYEDGVMTVKGAGKLGKSENANASINADFADATTDDFQFVYQKFTGDMEIVTKLDSYLVVDAHTFNGLMFRESLEDNAAAVGLGLSMVKIENNTVWSSFMVNRATKGGNMSTISETIDSASAAEAAGIPMVQDLKFKEGDTFNGTWLKLTRAGDTFTGYASEDGTNWQMVGTLTVDLPETVYVGFAVDSNKVANSIDNYATAHFSNIEINTEFADITYEVENVEVEGASNIAVGKDLSVQFVKVRGYLFPESVKVITASGNMEYTYDAETGILTLKNVTEDVKIKATGVKRDIVQVDYEIVDEGNFLTVEEKEDGTLVLTQTATTGKVAANATTPSVNTSYLLFPATKDYQTLSMKVKLTALPGTDDAKNSGLLVGAFSTESSAFTSLGFRACGSDSLAAYWTKAAGNVGNGSPKNVVALDMEYEVTFTTNKDGAYIVYFKSADGSVDTSKLFKVHENYMKQGENARYGIAIIGATAEISDLKVVDHEDNEIYPGNNLPAAEVTGGLENSSEELLEKVEGALSPEEKDALDKGAEVEIWVEVEDNTTNVSDDDRALVDGKKGNAKVGMYLDVNLMMQIGNAAEREVEETDGAVTISLKLIERLINRNTSLKRSYQIVRIHDGVAELLDCKFDAATLTISFETDKFSTYAIVFTDVVVASGNNNGSQNTGNAGTTADSVVTYSPQTGDINYGILLVVFIVCLGLGAVILRKKENKDS